MRVGILGGTFDPVHYGHLLLAECSREQCGLDEVWFMPAAQAPHKERGAVATGAQRLEMLRLACDGNQAFRVSTVELDRGGVSYTVQTLEALTAAHPGVAWFLLLGADSLADLPSWREPARICELATPVAVSRPGFEPPDARLLRRLMPEHRRADADQLLVRMPQVDFSSTDLRQRAATGRSLRYRTPPAVERYIVTQRLYRT